MTVLGHGQIFQPFLASLPYTQTCTHNNETIITLQNRLTLQIFIKEIQANVFDVALKLGMLHDYNEKHNRTT